MISLFWFLGVMNLLTCLNEPKKPVPHPIYVGVIDINHNEKENTLEVAASFFVEDFERILRRKAKNDELDLVKSTAKQSLKKSIFKYIQSTLEIKIKDKRAPITMLGYEVENPYLWIYLYVEDVTEVKKIEVMASVLFDFNKKQCNIVHCKSNGVRSSGRATIEEPVVVLSMEKKN